MKKPGKHLFFIPFALMIFALITINVYSFNLGGTVEKLKKVAKVGKSGLKAFSAISEEEQYYIGRSVGAQLLGQYKLTANSKLQTYISEIGLTLALASERPDTFKGYHYIVLDEPEKINAFAVPSGFIFISTGLIAKASNEDELAGILAHEVAHIVNYHPTDSIKKVYKDQMKKDIMSLAADEISAGQRNQIISGLVKGLNQVSGMLIDNAAKGYSREKEGEADLIATGIMKEAGYDPRALGAVLMKLEPVGSGNSGTHGDPKQRADDVLNQIKSFEKIPSIANERTDRFNIAIKSLTD